MNTEEMKKYIDYEGLIEYDMNLKDYIRKIFGIEELEESNSSKNEEG